MRKISLKAFVMREIARNQRVKRDRDPPPPLPSTLKIMIQYYIQGRIFIFSQEGWKNFGWGVSHVQYAILDALGGAWNGKPKCARGVKRNTSGVKHFPKGVKKILGGL